MQISSLPRSRQIEERIAKAVLIIASSMAVIMLVWLLWRTASIGLPYVNWTFLTHFPNPRNPAQAGIKSALFGTIWLGGLTLLFSLPIGVLAGIYMNEYARPGRFTNLLRITISNLAGVPSVVFGILGLAIFVRAFGLGNVLLAGALTLAVMSLPVIIVATEEALKSVPRSMREAAYGLGATKWQVTKDHVLPYATPGILTGTILALARAMGETAPLIIVGGAAAVFFVPDGPMSPYSALPLQTFYWALNPQAIFRDLAAAGTVVLLAIILLMNMIAIILRNRFQKKLRW